MFARLSVPFLFLAFLAPIQAQQSCTFTFSPSTWNFPIGAGSKQVTINASSVSCSRPGATTDSSWISLAGATVTGTGNGLLGVAVTSNTDGPPRQGTVSVGDAKMIITQDGATCTYKLSTDSTPIIPSWGASASLAVAPAPAKCGFTATSGNPDWIHLTSTPPAIGPGTLFYSVDPNPGAANRTGTITAGNRTVAITQDGSGCRFGVDLSLIQVTADGQSGSIAVTANGAACAWQASTGAAWLNLASTGGSGSGSLAYSVQANPTASPRSATILIGGVQVVVNQDGKQCAVSLSPASLFLGGASLTGNIAVTAPDGCSWQTDSDANWFNITSGASGSGAGTIAYSAPSNTTGQRRYGILTVGGVALPITQDSLNCGTTATPASFSLTAAGGSGTSNVASGCDWAAWPNAPWIQVASGAQGSGAGTVNFTSPANTSRSARTGAIQVGPAAIAITQAGQDGPPSTCAVNLSSAAAVTLPAAGGASTVKFTTTCNWTAWTSSPWINLPFVTQGSSDGVLAFAATPNTSTASRTATIQIGLATVTVTQAAQTPPVVCPVKITSPTAATVPAIGAAGMVTFTADGACAWTVSTAADWITVISGSVGQGNGLAAYVVERNLTASARTGTIAINGSTFTVTQSGPPVITKEGVTNAASFKNGPVAPGEIVTIFGSGIGATPMATLQLNEDKTFVTSRLAGTEILFDGIAAPVILSSDGQLNTVVPYEVSGQSSTYLQVWYQDNVSNPVQLDVAPTAPAIFTQNASGTGPGAIRNQDYSINTAANPAPRGSTIMIFATGEGQTQPDGVDGKVIGTDVLPQPVAPVTVSIGGKDAAVSYAGSAPFLIAGVLQVNAVIPDGVQTGPAIPITITVGGVKTPDGVTVAVK